MIVVATTPGRENWLAQCLASIAQPVLVLSDFTFELGKINWIFNNTTIERFFFLQDSVIIKDERLFELLDEKASIALTNDPSTYGMYMGVYERKHLAKIDIPIPQSKREAIEFEMTWTAKYCQAAKNVRIAFPDLADRNAVKKEIVFGRENLVLENDFLIKYKGNWGQLVV
jgi:hypothetical protein